jgi:TonB family protein
MDRSGRVLGRPHRVLACHELRYRCRKFSAAKVASAVLRSMPRPRQPTIYDATTPGITSPTAIRQVPPQYTAAALAARIQDTVLVTAVVLADGTVGDVTVIRSLDTVYGLDGEAITAAKQWLFTPAMLNGRPVAMRVTIEFTFTLR